MPTPIHMKPPMAAWIVTERRRLKLKPQDIVDRMAAIGREITVDTVKVWESNADRRPAPWNIEGLEQIFGSKAPVRGAPTTGDSAAAAAIDRQTDVLKQLLEETRLARVAQETVAVAVGELAGLISERLPLEETLGAPVPLGGGGSRR